METHIRKDLIIIICYLAGPIDLSKEGFQNWKGICKDTLAKHGITSIDPAGTFTYAQSNNKADRIGTAQSLMAINEFNLVNSDVAIIYISRSVPSIGTPIELKICADRKIPHVVVIAGDPKLPLPAYVEGLAQHIVYNMDQALEWVIDFVRDEIENNPEYHANS